MGGRGRGRYHATYLHPVWAAPAVAATNAITHYYYYYYYYYHYY